MIGTLLNAAAVILGGGLGLLLKKAMPQRLSRPIMVCEGVAIIIIALNGIITRMITVSDGALSSSGELLLLVSLVVGGAAGELLDIDRRVNRASSFVEKKLNMPGFSEGFVSASFIFCIGAMSIMGPMNEVLEGDMSLLQIKSFLDGVTGLTLAVTLGYGVLFAALPVVAIQGAVALAAGFFAGVPDAAISDVCAVGFCIVLCIGFNFVFETHIKTANLLPSLLVPVVYHLIVSA